MVLRVVLADGLQARGKLSWPVGTEPPGLVLLPDQ